MRAIAIIGFGIQGRRMAATLVAHPLFRIAAVWDPDEAARIAAAGLAATTPASVDAIFADPAIDCVYIASPPRSHLAYVARALDAGKAVFCEKPLSTDAAGAAALVARIEGAQARAAVNFSLANAPAFLAARAALARGAIGRPTGIAIEVAFRRWPRPWQADAAAWLSGGAEGGFTREVVSHFVWATRRAFGPLAVLSHAVERPAPGAAETRLAAAFTAGGLPGRVDGHVGADAAADDVNAWSVTGTAGTLRVFDWGRYAIGHGDPPPQDPLPEQDLGSATTRRDASRFGQLYALAALIDGRPHDLPTFREALDVQTAVEAMLA
jgi:predicted dehydrogenase